MKKSTTRVLLIDDDEQEYVLVRDMLALAGKADFQVEWVGTYDEGSKAVADGGRDAYLIDYYLDAGRNGLDLLKRAKSAGCKAPLILLTGRDDYSTDVEAMQAGAADYLPKGQFGPALLERVIRYAVERARLEAMLLQAEKLSAIGQFSAGIVHEISNPITVINWSSELALDALGSGHAAYEHVKTIKQAALRCKDVVHELLAFSRKTDPAPQEFELDDVVSSALTLICAQARLKSMEVRRSSCPQRMRLNGYKTQLEQALINLSANALDAMPRGGTLTIRTQKVQKEGRLFGQIQVADTGPGIPEDIRDKIFEPFFTTKQPGKGTGLGLALTSTIVSKHGGDISFSSESGRGTTFTITLPLL